MSPKGLASRHNEQMIIERRGLKPAAAFGYEASHPKHAAINPKGRREASPLG